MKYLSEILWYMIWPATLVVSYYVVLWFVKKYEKSIPSEDKE